MKELNVNVEGTTTELVVRQGQASPAKQPRKSISIVGSLSIIKERLSKLPLEVVSAINEHGDSKLNNSYILANFDYGTLELIEDGGSENQNSFKGQLVINPDLEEFGINTKVSRTTHELADFINMNRLFFESREVFMKLISNLRNFEAKVSQDLKHSDNQRGNTKFLRDQVVNSNIPEGFNLNIPIFKDSEEMTFEVEVIINPNDFSCSLVSPQLRDLERIMKKETLKKEIQNIREINDYIAIFNI